MVTQDPVVPKRTTFGFGIWKRRGPIYRREPATRPPIRALSCVLI